MSDHIQEQLTTALRATARNAAPYAKRSAAGTMKNQYFADRRDLFKYDLLLDIIESVGSGRLTFIPMLTPDDHSGEGRLTPSDKFGRREPVYRFLRTCLDSGAHDIRNLRALMSSLGVEFMPYCDDTYFADQTRKEYFDDIPDEYLERSLIFFDPDIGLETGTVGYMQRLGADKYLLY